MSTLLNLMMTTVLNLVMTMLLNLVMITLLSPMYNTFTTLFGPLLLHCYYAFLVHFLLHFYYAWHGINFRILRRATGA